MDKLSTNNLKSGEISRSPDILSGCNGIELSIIIVDYRSSKFTIDLIKNLEEKLADIHFEIIVVDNNPKGNTNKKIKQACKNLSKLKVVKANKNLGFGAGNNLGAKDAKGEYFLLLNPDTKIIDNSIQKMLDFLAKHSEVGALTPFLYQKDQKTLQRHFYGDFQSLAFVTLKHWKGHLPKINKNDNFFYVDMVSGAALMIKRSLFKQISGFDENFFMYIEDDDLCRRISDLGLKNAVLTSAKIIHLEGQSSTSIEKKKFYYQSQDYYWQKHYGKAMTALMKIIRAPYILWQKLMIKN
jgi:GT2 family glycosyltransferase